MNGIYLEVGDVLQMKKTNSHGVYESVHVRCVEHAGCKGCYFFGKNCGFLVCSQHDRLDHLSVIFAAVNDEGRAE